MTELVSSCPDAPLLTADQLVAATADPAAMDRLVVMLSKFPQVEMKPVHRFAPGMYIRELTMPTGSVVVSRIHKTTHPFVITKGRCSVFYEGGTWVHYEAPFTGITHAGTRRLLLIREETTWTTFHATDITDPDEWVEKNTSLLSDMSTPGAQSVLDIHRKRALPND